MRFLRYLRLSLLFILPAGIILILFVLNLSGCISAQNKQTGISLPDGNTELLEALFTDSTTMQAEQVFPLPIKDYDASILPNNYLPFIAYKGQAQIYFWARELASFDLYINNRKIQTASLCTGSPVCFDASPYIKNGRNMLYISGLVPAATGGAQKQQPPSTIAQPDSASRQPETSPEASSQKPQNPSLTIKIPYPVVLSGAAANNTVKNVASDNFYSKETFKLIDQLLTAETEHGFPGAQLVIIKNGYMIKSTAYGTISTVNDTGEPVDTFIPVTQKTLFDIASNTKMYAANFAVQKLISEKRLALTDRVQKFFPQFIDKKKDRIKGKADITIFDLLTHQSGFAAGGSYSKKITNLKNTTEKSTRELTLDLIMETPLIYEPRTAAVYSDINYMLLAYIIEKVTGMGLADYVTVNFYQPLGLERICFTPLKQGFMPDEIAATEIKAKRRSLTGSTGAHTTEPIHGTVHDAEAYTAMEEISGHAGLFANAESLAVLAQVMLNNGGYGTKRFFDPSVTAYFTTQQSLISSFGLGWRRQGIQEYNWAFSPLSSAGTFGHTGWTGTLTVIDPAEHLIIILLTNAKNTPAVHNGKFEGDYYLVKRYGAITALIYEAFRNPPQTKLDTILIELAEKKYEMLQEISAFNNDGYINDLAAIMSTVQLRSKKSATLRAFLKTKTAKDIMQTISRT